jgi:hypothetical protein
MKYVLVFLIALVLVDCFPYRQSTFTKEQRLKRRKKFKQEMVDCLLQENISGKLKSKIEEYKEDETKKVFFLLSSDIGESDKLAVRKCRRQTIISIRKIFGGRFHRTFNHSNPFYHDHFHHDNDSFEHKHEENHADTHPSHSGPDHSHKHEFNSEHSHSSNPDHSKMHQFNATHSHPSGSHAHPSGSHPHPSGSHPHPSGSHAHPSGSQPHPSGSHPHPSGSQPHPSGSHPHPSNSSKQ